MNETETVELDGLLRKILERGTSVFMIEHDMKLVMGIADKIYVLENGKENEGLINSENIAKMKDGVMIVNNSRGQLINEDDLAAALKTGKVAGAAVDVVYTEPIRSDNPLLTAPNCIITPHISWASIECRQRIMNTCAENIAAFIEGTPKNVVNK